MNEQTLNRESGRYALVPHPNDRNRLIISRPDGTLITEQTILAELNSLLDIANELKEFIDELNEKHE